MSEHGFLSPNPALFQLEQLKKRPGLAHELGQGAPCLKCKEKCPGFQLHYWRKVCMNCRCGKSDHNVLDQADPGFFFVGKLFDRPLRTKEEELHFMYGDIFDGVENTSEAGVEIRLDWVPPGASSNVVSKYLKSMPHQYVSIQGSEGAQRRKKQLEKQFPIHDVEPTNCHELTTTEIATMQSYVESVRQNIAGQGRVQELGLVNTSQSYTTLQQGVSSVTDQEFIPAWSKNDEDFYSNLPPPPAPELDDSGCESPPPPPLPSSMPPPMMSMDLSHKFGELGLGQEADNVSGMFHATPYKQNGGRFGGSTGSSLPGSTGSSTPSNSSSPSPPKTSPSFRSEIHRNIPAFIGLSASSSQVQNLQQQAHNNHLHHGAANIGNGHISPDGSRVNNGHNGAGHDDIHGHGHGQKTSKSPNVLPTAPKPVSILKQGKLSPSSFGSGDSHLGSVLSGAGSGLSGSGSVLSGSAMTTGSGLSGSGMTSGSVLSGSGMTTVSGLSGKSGNARSHTNGKDQGAGSWRCSGCGEAMLPGAVAIFAERAGQDKCWHPACFTCCSCGELLEDLLYFYSKGKLYCGRDFARMMDIPRCAACDELIFATEYTGAEDQFWHLKHFCCYVCDTPLAGHKYIPVNSQPHCLNCWQNTHGKVCNTCERFIHPEDQRVTLGESHWHANSDCFKCGICSKSLLGGKMTRRDGVLLCSSTCAATLSEAKHTHHRSSNSQASASPRTMSPVGLSPIISNSSAGHSPVISNGNHVSSSQILGNRQLHQMRMPVDTGKLSGPGLGSGIGSGPGSGLGSGPGSGLGSGPSSPLPPVPGPKPGMHGTTNLLPYQPLLHVQQPGSRGRHVQFARQSQDQSSDGYSSNHSTPPYHSRESSYSTIV